MKLYERKLSLRGDIRTNSRAISTFVALADERTFKNYFKIVMSYSIALEKRLNLKQGNIQGVMRKNQIIIVI